MEKFFGLVVAGAIVGAAIWCSAPRYAVTGDDERIVRIDVRNGDVSFCRGVNLRDAPVCSEFGSRTFAEYREELKKDTPPVSLPATRPKDPATILEEFNKIGRSNEERPQ